MIDEGYYAGKLISATFEAPEGKSPRMSLVFEIGGRDEEGNYVQGQQRRIVYLYMSDKAFQYSEEKLRRLGFNGNFEAPEFTSADNVELNCKHEEKVKDGKPTGQTVEKWDIAGGFKPQPAPPDVAKQFGAKWRATVGGPPAKPAGKPPAPPAAKTPPPAAKSPPPASKIPTQADRDKWKGDAWDVFVKRVGSEDVEAWQHEISARCKVKKYADETSFNEDDWKCVGDGVPF